ncbi:MAG TPA: hypothetical protein PKV71_09205 [Calditrichia bacterium]|nr:hypothetical protein [Calditrichota bacterium]HQV32041.1 hypothetical protein [Calditrichia bacterium]
MAVSLSFGDQTSPDGLIRIEYDWCQMKPSCWVRSPRITRLDTGEILLDLWGTNWDGIAAFLSDGSSILYLQEYPGITPKLKLRVDWQNATAAPIDFPNRQESIAELQLRLMNRN